MTHYSSTGTMIVLSNSGVAWATQALIRLSLGRQHDRLCRACGNSRVRLGCLAFIASGRPSLQRSVDGEQGTVLPVCRNDTCTRARWAVVIDDPSLYQGDSIRQQ
jgi:hypothetical protein